MCPATYGGSKVNFPHKTLEEFFSFFAEFPETLIAIFAFLTEVTHNKSMMTYFQKFLSENTCLEISQNLDFSKKWENFQKSNRFF